MWLINNFKMTLVQPTGEMSAKIREELREPDAEAVAKDVVAIREWLEKQPHLPKDMGKKCRLEVLKINFDLCTS